VISTEGNKRDGSLVMKAFKYWGSRLRFRGALKKSSKCDRKKAGGDKLPNRESPLCTEETWQ